MSDFKPVVGFIAIPSNAPSWLVQMSVSVSQVEPLGVIGLLEDFTEQVKLKAKEQAISEVRQLVAQYGLDQNDFFSGRAKTPKATRLPVAPKYRDPQTGATWSGRGVTPKWLNGKNRDEYLIASGAIAQ